MPVWGCVQITTTLTCLTLIPLQIPPLTMDHRYLCYKVNKMRVGARITTPMNQDAFSDNRLKPSLKRLGPKQGNAFPPISKKALAWWDLGAQMMAS